MNELAVAKATYLSMIEARGYMDDKAVELERQKAGLTEAREELDAKIKKQESLIFRLIQQEDPE